MPSRERKLSSKERLRRYFLAHVGEVVTARQLSEAAGTTEWARRIRELRGDEKWPIITNNDDTSLRPGQYKLTGKPPKKSDVVFTEYLSARLKAQVLDRNGFTCQSCGLAAGEIDPDTGRKVRLHIGHIVDKSLGGQAVLENLRALCSTCNQGAKNTTFEKPKWVWLVSQIRRAGQDEKRAAYEWLKKMFETKGN